MNEGESMCDEERIERILRQIESVDNKIKIYGEAKESVEDVKNNADNGKENWQHTFNRLKNHIELADVEKKDVFEGEMAQRLKELVSEGMELLTVDLSKADSLSRALDNQISKIVSKIQELEAERQRLYNML